MKYLIDTHTFIWASFNDSRLSKTAKDIFLDQTNEIHFSKASIWEMSIKIQLKKLDIVTNLNSFILNHAENNNINILDIALKHILRVQYLELHHRNPFDRLLIAQSILEEMPIISADKAFDKYDCKRIW